jgi:hypothetical protein
MHDELRSKDMDKSLSHASRAYSARILEQSKGARNRVGGPTGFIGWRNRSLLKSLKFRLSISNVILLSAIDQLLDTGPYIGFYVHYQVVKSTNNLIQTLF